MLNFFHTFTPDSVLISFGLFKVYWYGLLMASGIIFGLLASLWLARLHKINKEIIIDLSFWLIGAGIIGARLYHVFLEWGYYSHNLADILKVWEGGLALHGAWLGGILAFWLFARRHGINFLFLASLILPGLALGQAIGRWGNFFNQELFGRPTDLLWGIFISPASRPAEYLSSNFFHPVFLYESLGNLLIFLILIIFHFKIAKKYQNNPLSSSPSFFKSGGFVVFLYFLLYSLLRFFLEFIRIDPTFVFFHLRLPQIVSMLIIVIILIILILNKFLLKKPAAGRPKD